MVASPALVVVWVAGYAPTTQLGVPLTELWIAGGFALSFASLLALIYSASRDRWSLASFSAAALPLLVVLVLMACRLTWAALR